MRLSTSASRRRGRFLAGVEDESRPSGPTLVAMPVAARLAGSAPGPIAGRISFEVMRGVGVPCTG